MKSQMSKTLKALSIIPMMLLAAPVVAQQAYQLSKVPFYNSESSNSFGLTLNNAGYVSTTESIGFRNQIKVVMDGSGNFQVVPFHNLYDVNNSGVTVGSQGGWAHYFEDGQAIPIAGQEAALAINDAKQILGTGWIPGISSASLFDQGILHDIEQDVIAAAGYTPPGGLTYFSENVYGHGLNASGVVVGRYNRREDSSVTTTLSLAFSWKDGVVTFLDGLGGVNSIATDINDAGQIVGYAEKASGGGSIVIWNNGVPFDTGFEYGNAMYNIDQHFRINNEGVVMGKEFIYSNGVYLENNDLLSAEEKAPPFNSMTLEDINDRGQILATILYTDWNQSPYLIEYRAVLLTPFSACQ